MYMRTAHTRALSKQVIIHHNNVKILSYTIGWAGWQQVDQGKLSAMSYTRYTFLSSFPIYLEMWFQWTMSVTSICTLHNLWPPFGLSACVWVSHEEPYCPFLPSASSSIYCFYKGPGLSNRVNRGQMHQISIKLLKRSGAAPMVRFTSKTRRKKTSGLQISCFYNEPICTSDPLLMGAAEGHIRL